MPTIAQKLCQDIVVPGLKLDENVKGMASGKLLSSSIRHSVKSTISQRSGSLDRAKLLKYEPPNINNSKLRGNKSGVTVTKKNITNTSVNTLVSGPLKCDNNCVTSLRKRNNQGNCKCMDGKKKVNTKETQTLLKVNYSLSDKACFQCIEQVSCGTQILDNKSNVMKQIGINVNSLKPPTRVKEYDEDIYHSDQNSDRCTFKSQDRSRFSSNTSCKPNLRYISAKRWAVTNFPTRGPDF
ncbi:unnamed protein product [Danaus chrysippus]|uniref:(African queen) hypothetical protein n=1 Tax=Danaus chrysippus TaxID=151541 RepID=A0A8J2VT85_9NEOP|nr:unnamed protein product [Danaus chrysippus]